MSRLTRWLDRTLYPKHEARWDDELFRSFVLEHIRGHELLLDLGAGAGIVGQMNFRGHVARACGVDPDKRVLDNPLLDEARIGTGETVPYDDALFDVVVCNNVLEHLEDPVAVFREVARVLKPGGIFLAKTPNKRHYVPVIARITPHGFHQFANRLRSRRAVDTFPTRYRANTPSTVRRLASETDLGVLDIRLIEGRPEYLRFSAISYVFGWAYERCVNRFDSLAGFRVVMMAALQRPAR